MDFGNSPVLKHDGTTSSTTHYADGSPKSKREVDFSKRHEDEKSGSAKVYEYRLIAADGKTVVEGFMHPPYRKPRDLAGNVKYHHGYRWKKDKE